MQEKQACDNNLTQAEITQDKNKPFKPEKYTTEEQWFKMYLLWIVSYIST